MGLDYEKCEFTPEPHRMLSAQVFKIVSELEPGESGIVNEDVVWADRTIKRGAWIDGNADVLTDNQVIEIADPDPSAYSRIHCVREGLVLDRSHLEQRTWNWANGLFLRSDLEKDLDVEALPLIYCAFNSDELALAETALKKGGIDLTKLLGIPDLMQAIVEAEEIEEDVAIIDEIDESNEEDN